MSTFGEAEAAAVFEVIDTDSSGELSKSELQDYCTSNFINWGLVYNVLGLRTRISITSNDFKKGAAEGKLGMFAKTGDHGLSARNLSSAAGAMADSDRDVGSDSHHTALDHTYTGDFFGAQTLGEPMTIRHQSSTWCGPQLPTTDRSRGWAN